MTKLTETERAKLELEYRELCEDWRLRDKYVLDKLSAAGILFGLLGIALGTIPSTAWIIKLCLLFIGGLFSTILSISVAKDTYYRDGTQELVKRLARRLAITSSLRTLRSLKNDEDFEFARNEDFEFARKIKIKRDEYSLGLPTWFKWLQNPLLNRTTVRWILGFYLVSLFIFVSLFILILVNWRCGLNLPI